MSKKSKANKLRSLKKGVAQRKFPFNPAKDLQDEHTEDLKDPNYKINIRDKLRNFSKSEFSWRNPTNEELSNEYDWEYRHVRDAFGNVFPTKDHFLQAAKQSKLESFPEDTERTSEGGTVEDVKDMVSSYQYPRDVDRIVHGFKSGAQMPAPVVIRHNDGHFIMGGNTRQHLAGIHDIPRQALVVDISHLQKKEAYNKLRSLKKGVAQRKFPFNPEQVSPEHREAVETWTQGGGSDVDGDSRNTMPAPPTEALQRGLRKLHGMTDVRKNPQTGEREFLLHRGMGEDEFHHVASKNNYDAKTSWTPNIFVARNFARNYNEEFGESEGLEPKTVSAWIPESQIHHIPNAIGEEHGKEGGRPMIRQPEFGQEHEVVVHPHKLQFQDYDEHMKGKQENIQHRVSSRKPGHIHFRSKLRAAAREKGASKEALDQTLKAEAYNKLRSLKKARHSDLSVGVDPRQTKRALNMFLKWLTGGGLKHGEYYNIPRINEERKRLKLPEVKDEHISKHPEFEQVGGKYRAKWEEWAAKRHRPQEHAAPDHSRTATNEHHDAVAEAEAYNPAVAPEELDNLVHLPGRENWDDAHFARMMAETPDFRNVALLPRPDDDGGGAVSGRPVFERPADEEPEYPLAVSEDRKVAYDKLRSLKKAKDGELSQYLSRLRRVNKDLLSPTGGSPLKLTPEDIRFIDQLSHDAGYGDYGYTEQPEDEAWYLPHPEIDIGNEEDEDLRRKEAYNRLRSLKKNKKTPAKQKDKVRVVADKPAKEPKGPLTVLGQPIEPNTSISQPIDSTLDSHSGVLHTPRGSFKLYSPDHNDEVYHNILNDPSIQNIHAKAMHNWQVLHNLMKQRKIPEQLIANAAIFGIFSSNTDVPTQELRYSRYKDAEEAAGLDPTSPEFSAAMQAPTKGKPDIVPGPGYHAWEEQDSPTELPRHSREYWQKLSDAGVIRNKGEGKRAAGEIRAAHDKLQYSAKISHYPAIHKYLSDLIQSHGPDVQSIVGDMMKHKSKIKANKDHPMQLPAGLGSKVARYVLSMLGGGNAVVPDTHFVRHSFGLDINKDKESAAYLKNLLWGEKNHHLLNGIDQWYRNNHPAVRFAQDRYFGGKDDEQAIFPAFWLHWLTIAPHEKARGIGKPHTAKNLTDHTPYWNTAFDILDKYGLGRDIKKSEGVQLPVRAAAAMHELTEKLGAAPASMIFYAHIVPQLLGGGKGPKMTKSEAYNKLRSLKKDENLDAINPEQDAAKPRIPRMDEHSAHHGKKVFVYFNLHNNLWSVRHKGKVLFHTNRVSISDANLKVSEAGRQRVLREKAKNVHAGVEGTLAPHLDNSEVEPTQISYNPYKAGHFYPVGKDHETNPLHRASHVDMRLAQINTDAGPKNVPNVLAYNAEDGMEKSEAYNKLRSLKKGIAAKKWPTSGKISEKENKTARTWLMSRSPRHREALPQMDENMRQRGLHKLAGMTQVRQAENGERQYLLHRGMGGKEYNLHLDGKIKHRTSWTPNRDTAHGFKRDFGYGEAMSAWVPESQIHYIPNQIGNKEFESENEIIVKPHKMDFQPFKQDTDTNIHDIIDMRGRGGKRIAETMSRNRYAKAEVYQRLRQLKKK